MMKCLKNWSLLIVIVFLSVTINSQAAQVYPDEFDGPEVDTSFLWQKEPDEWDAGQTTPGWLHFGGVHGGNLWTTDDATRLYQEIGDEDFEIETHLRTVWGNNSSDVAGIVAKSPSADNWVMLKLWMHQDGTAQIQFQKKGVESGDGLNGNVAGFAPTGGEAEVWFKLKREGDECTGFYKASEGEEWVEIGVTSFPFDAPYQVGIFSGVDVGAGELITEFDYFIDNTSPFTLAVSPGAKLTTTWGSIKEE